MARDTNGLPPWPHWGMQEDWDDTLPNLETALDRGVIAACNIGRTSSAYQVSVRRDTDGWEVYYGLDIADTIARAVMGGPQSPPVGKPEPGRAAFEANHPELKAKRLAELEGSLTKAWPIGGPPHDDGVSSPFNSEGIRPL